MSDSKLFGEWNPSPRLTGTALWPSDVSNKEAGGRIPIVGDGELRLPDTSEHHLPSNSPTTEYRGTDTSRTDMDPRYAFLRSESSSSLNSSSFTSVNSTPYSQVRAQQGHRKWGNGFNDTPNVPQQEGFRGDVYPPTGSVVSKEGGRSMQGDGRGEFRPIHGAPSTDQSWRDSSLTMSHSESPAPSTLHRRDIDKGRDEVSIQKRWSVVGVPDGYPGGEVPQDGGLVPQHHRGHSWDVPTSRNSQSGQYAAEFSHGGENMNSSGGFGGVPYSNREEHWSGEGPHQRQHQRQPYPTSQPRSQQYSNSNNMSVYSQHNSPSGAMEGTRSSTEKHLRSGAVSSEDPRAPPATLEIPTERMQALRRFSNQYRPRKGSLREQSMERFRRYSAHQDISDNSYYPSKGGSHNSAGPNTGPQMYAPPTHVSPPRPPHSRHMGMDHITSMGRGEGMSPSNSHHSVQQPKQSPSSYSGSHNRSHSQDSRGGGGDRYRPEEVGSRYWQDSHAPPGDSGYNAPGDGYAGRGAGDGGRRFEHRNSFTLGQRVNAARSQQQAYHRRHHSGDNFLAQQSRTSSHVRGFSGQEQHMGGGGGYARQRDAHYPASTQQPFNPNFGAGNGYVNRGPVDYSSSGGGQGFGSSYMRSSGSQGSGEHRFHAPTQQRRQRQMPGRSSSHQEYDRPTAGRGRDPNYKPHSMHSRSPDSVGGSRTGGSVAPVNGGGGMQNRGRNSGNASSSYRQGHRAPPFKPDQAVRSEEHGVRKGVSASGGAGSAVRRETNATSSSTVAGSMCTHHLPSQGRDKTSRVFVVVRFSWAADGVRVLLDPVWYPERDDASASTADPLGPAAAAWTSSEVEENVSRWLRGCDQAEEKQSSSHGASLTSAVRGGSPSHTPAGASSSSAALSNRCVLSQTFPGVEFASIVQRFTSIPLDMHSTAQGGDPSGSLGGSSKHVAPPSASQPAFIVRVLPGDVPYLYMPPSLLIELVKSQSGSRKLQAALRRWNEACLERQEWYFKKEARADGVQYARELWHGTCRAGHQDSARVRVISFPIYLLFTFMPEFHAICTHMFGNYMAQQLLKSVPVRARMFVAAQLALWVRAVGSDARGTRPLQHLILFMHRRRDAQLMSAALGLHVPWPRAFEPVIAHNMQQLGRAGARLARTLCGPSASTPANTVRSRSDSRSNSGAVLRQRNGSEGGFGQSAATAAPFSPFGQQEAERLEPSVLRALVIGGALNVFQYGATSAGGLAEFLGRAFGKTGGVPATAGPAANDAVNAGSPGKRGRRGRSRPNASGDRRWRAGGAGAGAGKQGDELLSLCADGAERVRCVREDIVVRGGREVDKVPWVVDALRHGSGTQGSAGADYIAVDIVGMSKGWVRLHGNLADRFHRPDALVLECVLPYPIRSIEQAFIWCLPVVLQALWDLAMGGEAVEGAVSRQVHTRWCGEVRVIEPDTSAGSSRRSSLQSSPMLGAINGAGLGSPASVERAVAAAAASTESGPVGHARVLLYARETESPRVQSCSVGLPAAVRYPSRFGLPGVSPYLCQIMTFPRVTHVVQCLLTHFWWRAVLPVVRTAFEFLRFISCAKNGVCVVKRCLSLVQDFDRLVLCRGVLENFASFCADSCGFYIIQHLLDISFAQLAVEESGAVRPVDPLGFGERAGAALRELNARRAQEAADQQASQEGGPGQQGETAPSGARTKERLLPAVAGLGVEDIFYLAHQRNSLVFRKGMLSLLFSLYDPSGSAAASGGNKDRKDARSRGGGRRGHPSRNGRTEEDARQAREHFEQAVNTGNLPRAEAVLSRSVPAEVMEWARRMRVLSPVLPAVGVTSTQRSMGGSGAAGGRAREQNDAVAEYHRVREQRMQEFDGFLPLPVVESAVLRALTKKSSLLFRPAISFQMLTGAQVELGGTMHPLSHLREVVIAERYLATLHRKVRLHASRELVPSGFVAVDARACFQLADATVKDRSRGQDTQDEEEEKTGGAAERKNHSRTSHLARPGDSQCYAGDRPSAHYAPIVPISAAMTTLRWCVLSLRNNATDLFHTSGALRVLECGLRCDAASAGRVAPTGRLSLVYEQWMVQVCLDCVLCVDIDRLIYQATPGRGNLVGVVPYALAILCGPRRRKGKSEQSLGWDVLGGYSRRSVGADPVVTETEAPPTEIKSGSESSRSSLSAQVVGGSRKRRLTKRSSSASSVDSVAPLSWNELDARLARRLSQLNSSDIGRRLVRTAIQILGRYVTRAVESAGGLRALVRRLRLDEANPDRAASVRMDDLMALITAPHVRLVSGRSGGGGGGGSAVSGSGKGGATGK